MTLTTTSRDGLLAVADIYDNGDGSQRVTIMEMIGQRGYLSTRLKAARALARRATGLTGPTHVGPVHWYQCQEFVSITVKPFVPPAEIPTLTDGAGRKVVLPEGLYHLAGWRDGFWEFRASFPTPEQARLTARACIDIGLTTEYVIVGPGETVEHVR
jgi:hypothetical protein